MGSLHWLIIFPYYFFTALGLFLLLTVLCRLAGAKMSANPLAMTAVVVSVVLTAFPLVTGITRLADYSWPGLLWMLVVSLLLATGDALLQPRMALPLDDELRDV